MKTIHALMIAINNYPNPRHKLRGCLNDLYVLKTYLKDNFILTEQDGDAVQVEDTNEKEKIHLRIKQLTNSAAYRQNIIDGFDHFKNAKDGDICLLFYSGHGSRVKAPKEFWNESPSRMLETIVCHDSRLPGGRDLTDKELRYLIWNATKNKDIHFLAVMDSCHAGSVTRDTAVTSKMAEVNPIPTEFKEFEGYHAYEEVVLKNGEITYKLPIAENFVTLAAAQNKQTAKELLINGVAHGIFTYSLVEALKKSNGQMSYLSLMDKLNVLVAHRVSEQSPQLESTRPEDKFQRFLNGTVPKSSPTCMVYYDDKEHHAWLVNKGVIQGMTASIDGEDTVIKLKINGEKIKVTQIFANKSIVTGVPKLMTRQPYEATIQSLASPRINVAFARNCNQEAKTNIESLLTKGISDYFQMTTIENAEYLIKTLGGSLILTNLEGIRPQFKRVEGFSEGHARQFIEAVNKIGKWRKVLDLSNPNSTITADEIEIELSSITEIGNFNDNAPSEIIDWRNKPVFRYEYKKGKWIQPALKLKIKNKSHRNFWVSGILLADDFEITNKFLQKEELKTEEEAKFRELFKGKKYEVFPLSFDDSYHSWGITEISLHLKIIISTDELNTDHFNQKGLELDVKKITRGKTKSAMGRGGSIDQPDWITKDIEIILVRPKDTEELKPAQAAALAGIVIEGHPSFEAKVTLVPTTESTRAVGISAPHHVAALKNMSPLELTAGYKNTPGLSVMEFYNAKGTEQIDAENPLVMNLDQQLAENEIVLAIGYDQDSGLYYPLGEMNEAGKIIIEDLPDETASGTKSLGGSIKIFFQKIVLSKLGLYEYPSLQMAVVDKFEELKYNNQLTEIKEAVKAANKIVLFIHGIIGDTLEMTKAVRRARNENGENINEQYDLVLTFDYENLSTDIDQTSRDLKKALAKIGLEKEHGKTLDIIAHSMGGLVSRWFIEKEGGNEIVSHLMMLGTPNGGSEWASVQELATTLLARAINGASFLQPWLTPLSIAGRYFKKVFNCLQMMGVGSEFLKKLNDGTDPGIPYTIIAGDTSQIPVQYTEKEKGLFKKIIKRFRKRGHYDVLQLALFKGPNDIAVRTDNITGIEGKEKRKFPPTVIEIPCDHISYFADEHGLSALAVTVFSKEL